MVLKRQLLTILLIYTSVTFLLGCSVENSSNDVACYSTAEEFEEALNNGSDCIGAMVTFTAGITEPGPGCYNMYAGKKLAFISSDHPNINPGSTVTLKVKTVKNIEGTWNIEYER